MCFRNVKFYFIAFAFLLTMLLVGDQVGSDLCGFELPGPVSIENSQQVSVKFVSDSTVQYEGFAIDVTFGSNSERKID